MKMQTIYQKVFLLGVIIALSVSAVMGIIAVFIGTTDPLWAKIFRTTFLIGTTSILGLAGSTSHVLGGARPTGILCIGASAAAVVLTLYDIWTETSLEWVLKLLQCLWPAAIALGLAGLLALATLKRPLYRWIRRLTWLIYALFVCLMCVFVWWTREWLVERLLLSASILGLLGTVVVPILHRVSSLEAAAELQKELADKQLQITCPRCGESQQLPFGNSNCGKCGLGLSVRLRI
jgi:hypothetical protein